MNAGERYRKLYSYFQEVCTNFLYLNLHETQNVPTSGEEMYRDLRQRLTNIYNRSYDVIINEHEFLTEIQKVFLLPNTGAINLENLDLVMYIKINSLLVDGESEQWIALNRIRNHICHLSMEKLRGDKDIATFNREFKWLKKSLARHGLPPELLVTCERNIFNNNNLINQH